MSDRRGAEAPLWIVQGADVVSGNLSKVLAESDVTQLQQVAADIVVLSMPVERAKQLQTEFPELIVEANTDLKPLDQPD